MTNKTLFYISFLLLFGVACAGIRAMSGDGLFTDDNAHSDGSYIESFLVSNRDTYKFFGFRDHPSIPDSMLAYGNTGKSLAADDTRPVTRSGLPAIPIISGC